MKPLAALTVSLVLCSCAAESGPGPSAVPAAPPRPVVLLGPEVAKLDWNTRALQVRDLDGDGRLDLALINNDRARIELLYQKRPGDPAEADKPSAANARWEPVLEDARFRHASVVTGQAMFALAVADLDGDGKPDLVYTGKPDTLTIRYQGANGDFSRKRVIDIGEPVQWPSSLATADLDGDHREDLVVLTQKDLLVFMQNAKGELTGPDRYPLPDEGCYGLRVADLDGDGLPDLAYLAPGKRDPLRVRFRNPKGGYGPERAFHIEQPRGELTPIHLEKGGTGFSYIQAQTGLVECFTLEADKSATGLKPRVFSTRSSGRGEACYALGDFNGDHRMDLAVSDPQGAQVLVYLQKPEGGFAEAESFPCLSDVRSLAAGDVDGSGQASLFIVSPKEKTLAVSRLSPKGEGRMGYPQPIPCPGKPLAVAAGDLDGDGVLDLACVTEEDGKRNVVILTQEKKGGAWKVKSSVELAGLRTDPKAIRILDADQDGKPDLAVFTVQEPMRLLLQQADGSFKEASNPRKGLVDNLEPSALTLGDLDGDGKPEMLVAGTGFARALKAGSDGSLEVLDQFNAKESDAEVAAAIPVDLDGDGVPEIVLVDKKADSLQVLRRDARKVYRAAESIPCGHIDLVGSEVLDLDGDGKPDLLLFGKDRFWWIPTGRGGLGVKSLGTYESTLKDLSYGVLAAGDLNGDALVAIDMNEHQLEILSRDDKAWVSRMHFTVFESDPHYQGRRGGTMEPREAVIADVTGDGKPDLILLVHDRVLVYPQE